MSMNFYVKALVADELSWRTNISNAGIADIAENVAQKILARRHTVVPTYLTDEMYDAVKTVIPGIDFKQANEMYRAAITEYGRRHQPVKNEDDTPSFW